ncbi:nuclear transport factor 2 family protein [Pseudonocardia halophobica]|uniref:nuclear transport factor 2 family protein n=1 Tax=Pseudonocardia halophobica TaxID=29401 RepID=UPI003D8A2018
MTNDSQIQYLLDRFAIQDVLATYAKGQDDFQGNQYEGTLETWARIFTDDGEVDYTSGGGPRGPWREMLAWMRGTPEEPGVMTGAFGRWQHMLGLPIVTIEGDTASARHDLLATHTTIDQADGGVHFYDACTFTDELVRTPEGWRIRFRMLEVHWAGALQTAKNFSLQ